MFQILAKEEIVDVIDNITSEIVSVSDVKLLDVDPGKDTNRTVVTFVGPPDAVIDAAYLAIKSFRIN